MNNKTIAFFTVTIANEAGVDLVLIQPFLLYHAKLVVDMLTSIFLSKEGRKFISKQGQPQPYLHLKARTPSPHL